ncbi:MAG: DUF1614 domain-containing protein [Clostridia bacterium]|nr:DUF1614 domain-containing protein [Clostridia bacterium]
MSAGMMILTVVAVLLFCGVLQRVLDRMYLSDRAALLLIALMFVGGLLPNVEIGRVSVSLGGAVIPTGVCLWLLIKADTVQEKLRSLGGVILTGTAIYLLGRLLPAEAEELPADPNLIYGAAAGVIACILGRSRRCAFICGVLGVIAADVAVALINWSKGVDQQLVLGGAGLADTAVISGVLAVLLAELVGEIRERFMRGRKESEKT